MLTVYDHGPSVGKYDAKAVKSHTRLDTPLYRTIYINITLYAPKRVGILHELVKIGDMTTHSRGSNIEVVRA